jgi:hypothetical protein
MAVLRKAAVALIEGLPNQESKHVYFQRKPTRRIHCPKLNLYKTLISGFYASGGTSRYKSASENDNVALSESISLNLGGGIGFVTYNKQLKAGSTITYRWHREPNPDVCLFFFSAAEHLV